ncbi:uncharacterized protein LOC111876180 isoform X2 [Lactuca sativa]|uniref:uncharacterized protein LOC111876180 isoform X2 n=1 Tax=Lactuca sativa TaxID=4236 RepID=UPI001C68BE6F|nr:uncharacterized protein LOC111876180 isoform X2 [Lactuca sativa]
MPEFAFLDQHNRQLRSNYDGGGGGGGSGGRGVSPDSVIHSVESNLSLFSSSASDYASIERCSSTSDVLDHESFVSDMSLPGGFRGSSSARSSDPDPNKNSKVHDNGGPYLIGKRVEKAQETDGDNQSLYSARSSFSHTTKECQNRKSKTEILLRKPDRRRPASLDLNNQTMNTSSSSPRLGEAMKTSISAHRNGGMFPSPGTPNYPARTGFQNGWSSERVASHTRGNRIHSSFSLMPYNNGRTLPSKWEDAERWIISPVALKPSVQQPQRRPKSKSGPLGPPGSTCYSMYSPAISSFERENARNFVNESPLPNRVNANNNSLIQYQDGLERSVSVHGCSQVSNQSLLQITQDDKTSGSMDVSTNVSHDISRRDMATQMSPESSTYSSKRNSSSISNSILSVEDSQHVRSSKADIRDVQVDGKVTLTRWSKKSKTRIPGRWSDILDARSADWEALEMTKSLSKVKREEAKITAWENLQKAKAEAAIRKLEMKLEKKRSSSMDRIMNKLRTAQKKAQEMRESILSNQSYKVATSSHKAMSLIKTRSHIRSLSGCFTCPAF